MREEKDMKRFLKVIIISIFLTATYSCGSSSSDTAPAIIAAVTDSLTVSSPVSGSETVIPFTITGLAGGNVTQVVINAGESSKSATVSGGTWSVDYASGDLKIGILEFDIKGKDVNGNVLISVSHIIKVTDNGTGKQWLKSSAL
jgi:hypothetical protein